mmetsp:Transcript_48343/g.67172  ORF Transcript_48343/g.67172 Transcript_48343/m.67172 type:complete len:115 (-) Transcript_48343:58-402(-)
MSCTHAWCHTARAHGRLHFFLLALISTQVASQTAAPTSQPEGDDSNKLSEGAIAAIAVVGLIFFLGLLFLFAALAGIVPKPWSFRDADTAVDELRNAEKNSKTKTNPLGNFGLM